jgi:hypothetical protein
MPGAQKRDFDKEGARAQVVTNTGCHYLDAGSAPVHKPGAQESNFTKAGARAQDYKYQPAIILMLPVGLFICLVPRSAISPKQVPGPRVINTSLSLP